MVPQCSIHQSYQSFAPYFFRLISAFFFQLGLSQIPETLSYQGALSDADGIMVEDGTYSITFQLGNTEGDPDWEEVHSLSVINGLVTTLIIALVTGIAIAALDVEIFDF